MASRMSLEEKIALFSACAVTDEDVDEEDEDEEAADAQKDMQARSGRRGSGLQPAELEHRRKSRAFEKAAAIKRATESDHTQAEPLGHSSEKQPVSSADLPSFLLRRTASAAESSSSSAQPLRSGLLLRRTASNPQPSMPGHGTSVSASSDLKRKRESTGATDQENASTASVVRGVFDGLAFYYIPNASLGPRKLRIARARQHGAQWVQHIREATHVIVDKKLSWNDIQIVLGAVFDGSVTSRPEGEGEINSLGTTMHPFVLVNEEYPLDCLSFRRLLNPEQRRYYVRGSPAATKAAAAAAAAVATVRPQRQEAKPRDDRINATNIIKRPHHRYHRFVTPSPPPTAEQAPPKRQRKAKGV